MEWIEIKRDRDGLATEECLDEMFDNILILVAINECSRVCHRFIECKDQEDWRGEINRDKHYTHYLPVIKRKLLLIKKL